MLICKLSGPPLLKFDQQMKRNHHRQTAKVEASIEQTEKVCRLAKLNRGNDCRQDSIEKSRMGFTSCPSVWGNGEIGPMFTKVRPGYFPEKLVKEFNTNPTNIGKFYIQSKGATHFMNGESVVQMYDKLYKPHFRMRRLNRSTEGVMVGLQHDAFKGFSAKCDGNRTKQQRVLQET